MVGGMQEAAVQRSAVRPAAGLQLSPLEQSRIPKRAHALALAFKANGFEPILEEPFTQGSRVMFNRGRDGVSNYSVLVEAAGEKLRAYMMNPDESVAANALPYDKIVVSVCEGGELVDAKFVEEAVKAALEMSAKKPENAYYAQMHFHLGRVGEEVLNALNGRDDGLSSFGAAAINLLFANTDYAAQTMHNNFDESIYAKMEGVLASARIVAVPGMEATMPIFARQPWFEVAEWDTRLNPNPNGPHVVLLGADARTMREIKRLYFSMGKYKYASSSHATDDMERLLEIMKGKYGEKIAVIFAHPLCDARLPQVGLLERAAYGEIPPKRLEGIIGQFAQGVAYFNGVLKAREALDFHDIRKDIERQFADKPNWLKRKLSYMSSTEKYLRGLLGNAKLFRNTLNMAFANAMAEKFHIVPVFESDSHNQNWLYLPLFNGHIIYWIKQVSDFGRGHNTLLMPPESNRRLDSGEFVQLFHEIKARGDEEGKPRMKPKVYLEPKASAPRIARQRTRGIFWQALVDEAEQKYHYLFTQGPTLIGDAKSVGERANGEAAQEREKEMRKRGERLARVRRDPMAGRQADGLTYMAAGSLWRPKYVPPVFVRKLLEKGKRIGQVLVDVFGNRD